MRIGIVVLLAALATLGLPVAGTRVSQPAANLRVIVYHPSCLPFSATITITRTDNGLPALEVPSRFDDGSKLFRLTPGIRYRVVATHAGYKPDCYFLTMGPHLPPDYSVDVLALNLQFDDEGELSGAPSPSRCLAP